MANDSLFPLPAPTVALAAEIKSLTRELGMRRSVYARRVADNKMSQAEADREIACTEATLARLQALPRWVAVADASPPAGWHGLAAPDAQPILEEACFAYERDGLIYDIVTMTPDRGLLCWLCAPGLFSRDTWTVEEPTASELAAIRQVGRVEMKEALRQQEAEIQAGGGQGVVGGEAQGND